LGHFWLFSGYRYALSAAGLFVGRDILPWFYRSNAGRPKKGIQTDAWWYFHEFRGMFRPILLRNVGYPGTVTDGKLLVCHVTSGQPWAQIALVNTGYQTHAVMVPAFNSTNSVSTFINFLNNNEKIQVSTAQFDRQNLRWTIYNDRMEHLWPLAENGLSLPGES